MTQSPRPYQTPTASAADFEHIKLLVIFTYIWGGLLAFFSLFGLIYVFMGAIFVTAGSSMFPTASPAASGPPPQAFGWIFIVMGSCFVLFGWVVAGLNLYSARSMQLRRRRTFSLVISGINCLSLPLGTALGVFTFIVLLRASVAEMYRLAENAVRSPGPNFPL